MNIFKRIHRFFGKKETVQKEENTTNSSIKKKQAVKHFKTYNSKISINSK